MQWFYGAVLIGALALFVFAWEFVETKLKEAAKTNKNAAKTVAAGKAAVSGGRWLFQKGLGVVTLVAGIFFLRIADGEPMVIIAALASIGYSVYLLWPGSRSFFFVF